jgi:hypothetical protein
MRKKHIFSFSYQQQPWFSVYNDITSRETLFWEESIMSFTSSTAVVLTPAMHRAKLCKNLIHRCSGLHGEMFLGLCSDGHVLSTDIFRTRTNNDPTVWNDIVSLKTIERSAMGLCSDGTVVTAGKNYLKRGDVSEWTDIISIAPGVGHTLGLRSDGTVVATGNNDSGQCNVSEWSDIIAVAVGAFHSVGLKSNGTVVAVGSNEDGKCDVKQWTGVTEILCDPLSTSALRWDSTPVTTHPGRKDTLSDWKGVRSFADAHPFFIGISSSGTPYIIGKWQDKEGVIRTWTDVVDVAASYEHILGLRADGTVLSAGLNKKKECEVSHWRDIVAVFAFEGVSLGIRSDGTVVVAGGGKNAHLVTEWKLFNSIDELEQRFDARKKTQIKNSIVF